MDVETLREKVEAAMMKVVKCKETIERHEKQLQKKIASHASQYEIKYKEEDIKNANSKLRDSEIILSNWIEKLDKAISKEKFIQENTPQVIREFMEDWKQKAIKWSLSRYLLFQEFKKENQRDILAARIHCVKTMPEYASYIEENGDIKEYHMRDGLINVHPRKPIENYLFEKELDYKSIKKAECEFAGTVVMKMDEFRDSEERMEWLERTMEAEKKAKIVDLVQRINDIVGTITDASYLQISEKGNIDGYVIGSKANAHVHTIGASGEVQTFHYRTLVHEYKGAITV